ncbi:MAG: hypothetical protein WBB19_08470 [Desulforhopalus sp.]
MFHHVQRGKVLPELTNLGGHLLLAVDGTGFHSSEISILLKRSIPIVT